MQAFFINSVVATTFFSAIKFCLNLVVISLLLPSDYGMILLPLILFSFLDLFLEGGFHASIIKFNASAQDINYIFKKKLKWGMLLSPLLCFSLVALSTLLNLSIPAAVIISFMILSLIKLTNYFYEAKLIAEGFYIKTEFLNFLVTVSAYSAFIIIIPLYEISGYYFLCLLSLIIYSLYGSLLFYYYKKIPNTANHSTYADLRKFSHSLIQSSFIFNIGGRLDEFAASIIFNPSMLGIFSKVKEFGIMFGVFSSKILTRPWYYIACNIDRHKTQDIYVITSISILVLFGASIQTMNFLLSYLINFLGPNWLLLANYSDFIILIFALYFLINFSSTTFLALGKETTLLIIDRFIFAFKVLMYIIFFIYLSYADSSPTVETILYLEIGFKLLNLLIQYCNLIPAYIQSLGPRIRSRG